MQELRFRQVHLDFHTSEVIPGIGTMFSKEQFQLALKIGHVDSITVFSKCHHGWAYHPSKANEMHPHLQFDLLGAMIEAAHEIGVKTPVYLSAGLDEKLARRHPEWLYRNKDETTTWVPDFTQPGYHLFCFHSPYLEILIAQIQEVVKNYDADGIFLDIVKPKPCYCQSCVKKLLEEGKDPYDEKNAIELGERLYAYYTKRVREAIDQYKPGLPVFHNGGHISRGRRDLAVMNTHLELESLPTGGWGYDHFPASARYAQTLKIDFLGMTGKFHTSWGEFGGFKHPNALRYETALSIANGAKCSIGDQLHPNGEMDLATYELVGKAYEEVEQKEPWCRAVENVADVALLSYESVQNAYDTNQDAKVGNIDTGAVRMLLQGKILFDIIDQEADFTAYKVLILPDHIRITPPLKKKLEDFFSTGGKVLATGESGLELEENVFAIDLGVKWISKNPYHPDYFRPGFSIKDIGESAFIFYGEGEQIEKTHGEELGRRENPYFNRSTFAFCSHRHTPNSGEYGGPGMVESKNGIYIAWKIFEDFGTLGSLPQREVVLYALECLLGRKRTLTTSLPSLGITTLMHQYENTRYVNHLLYAPPILRGEKDLQVIEDLPSVYDTKVAVKIPQKVKRVYLAPQMEEIPFEQDGDSIGYTVREFVCHQMVVIEY